MDSDFSNYKSFTKNLIDWQSGNHRPMPWKGEKNPYLVWLSEIILQQTRVEQGLPYFEKFKEKYPTVDDLAHAPSDEVMKMWEGLGYYSRARNLHAAAKYISNELNGHFPEKFDEIKKLKGVGPYTAAAVASFAFDLPYAVVDGNVYRVLSRYFNIDTPIDSTEGKKQFALLAQELLDKNAPGIYNQAIMDFGATLCTPALPKCPDCPMQKRCGALKNDTVGALPVKLKKLKRTERHFNYLVISWQGNFFIKKRTGKDIWQNLYEFPLIETEALEDSPEAIISHKFLRGSAIKLNGVSPPLKQDLTHQRIIARFWKIELSDSQLPDAASKWKAVTPEKMKEYAFPKVIAAYLRQKLLTLELF